MTVICDYCGNPAEFVGGKAVFPRRPDLYRKQFWRCLPCRAWVGCHEGTSKPLGRLADVRLRQAKMRAHAAFDPVWRDEHWRQGKGRRRARSEGYAWLAAQLGIPIEHCHIGLFDVATCERVVDISNQHQRARAA